MKINPANHVNFSKYLLARGSVLKDKKPLDVNIYKLESKEDLTEEFSRAGKDEIWHNNKFLDKICSKSDFFSSFYDEIFALEDLNGDLLSYCIVYNNKTDKSKCVEYVEAAPDISLQNKNRNLKYAGETILAFLAKIAKIQKKNFVVCNDATGDINYYKNHGFESYNDLDKILPPDKIDNFIELNKEHTGSRIDIIAGDI